jgi:hypothetical protein
MTLQCANPQFLAGVAPPRREIGSVYDATVGLMFAFSLKRFLGSYLFFNCTSRG